MARSLENTDRPYVGARQFDIGAEEERGPWAQHFEDEHIDVALRDDRPIRDRTLGIPYPRGPKGYKRLDQRVLEDVSDAIAACHQVDASEVEVHVHDGEVVLTGMVPRRFMKHLIEELCERVVGVGEVMNLIHVDHDAEA
ncbi:MAG: BON domain-containing protein [Polyangiaceae bacterium]|nr:BON domain-containing protein [Polyangiaceae bacterium]